ncbi:MAG TPA: FAD-dependent oxidoreductase [Cyanobacteria bacterium UBA11149]|nr:FAD-dependent oxidoreductase [Cyanobacteria bacterium UBA11367]HBE59163.1 FAD-dependent oxidoreductase [Cyanobacteria bacterium UBA11366]HBK64988.1 FAD-dependent oxidoreductase [Cyanobacteria bacterium UBA11166]HBR72727.1 FAD-dependent oxidoreductase [Cyanobacteria bacterium UBA11159]HBS69208.1 FAD-dependent oxidoreductase [Cyanobacteria bacterium UBA11153]HBW90261.1 FAD-dependent oxidoreductase [Cyanobacteria bacterium UBA11149]HCA94089.1 FAD-dependent oxidoreductase [Cyanobacteria bacter
MKESLQTNGKDLVLIGGGHSHAIALRLFGINHRSGLRITLISDVSHTPYSGMLPGHIAGFYNFAECHIDLQSLTRFAGAKLYIDQAIGLDLDRNRVICANRPPVPFDILSIDIGSTPAQESVPGVAEYTIPAKPVPQFLNQWQKIIAMSAIDPEKSISLGIVGGGAGGVELALTMARRIQLIPAFNVKIHLIHRGAALTPSYNQWVQKRLDQILSDRGISIHLRETVSQVLPDRIICESGLTIPSNYTFWVTHASAANWIKESGLATDGNGFILVRDTLQSLSHPHIFAAGDIATMVNHPRPKAGVFAVRQGKPLFENLSRSIPDSKALQEYIPQQRYLSLIGTGDGSAIASWGPFGWQSPLLWHWKDRIDHQFMAQFRNLPEMAR